jgi:hypothetical protein
MRTVVLFLGLACSGTLPLVAQDQTAERARTREDARVEVTYGRIKHLTAERRIVVEVDNKVDKAFDLRDKNTSVRVAADLAVGDRVKVMESETAGKKHVEIVRNVEGGEKK